MPTMELRRGQSLKVFMGAGWAKGALVRSLPNAWVVELPGRGLVTVYDPRNIRPLS